MALYKFRIIIICFSGFTRYFLNKVSTSPAVLYDGTRGTIDKVRFFVTVAVCVCGIAFNLRIKLPFKISNDETVLIVFMSVRRCCWKISKTGIRLYFCFNRRFTRLPGCIRLPNELNRVWWGVKLYSLTHSLTASTVYCHICDVRELFL